MGCPALCGAIAIVVIFIGALLLHYKIEIDTSVTKEDIQNGTCLGCERPYVKIKPSDPDNITICCPF